MKLSGFTFVHNALNGGYPIVEAVNAVRPYVDEIVAVDIQSDDGTEQLLPKICNRVLTSTWDGRDTTPRAFLKHAECEGDIIIFFEADEVYDDSLLREAFWAIERGHHNLAVWRLQISQNFQRIRQYPIPVHRIFPKGGGTYHIHPTNVPESTRFDITIMSQSAGYLWDVSNCFHDNWLQRKAQQSEIWGEPRHLMVREHFTEPTEITEEEEIALLDAPHWTWTETPLRLPEVLRPLVGRTRYEVEI